MFRAHAAPYKVCDYVVNALKLLANHHQYGDSLQERCRLKMMEGCEISSRWTTVWQLCFRMLLLTTLDPPDLEPYFKIPPQTFASSKLRTYHLSIFHLNTIQPNSRWPREQAHARVQYVLLPRRCPTRPFLFLPKISATCLLISSL